MTQIMSIFMGEIHRKILPPTTTTKISLTQKKKEAKVTGGRNKNSRKKQISVNYVKFQKEQKKMVNPSFFHIFLAVLR